jgi:AcrR family transcriptional regulator
MRVPRIVDHHQRRREVSAATLRVVVREGLNGVTIRSVARESGWSTGVLNHYFENKRALLLAALREAATQAEHNLQKTVRSKKSSIDVIRATLEEMLPLDERRKARCEVFASFHGEAASDPNMAHEMERYYTSWRRVVRDAVVEGQADGSIRSELDPTIVSEMLVAMADGLGLQGIFDPTVQSPRHQRQLVSEWLGYLRATSDAVASSST